MADGTGKIRYVRRYEVRVEAEVDMSEIEASYGFDPFGLSVDDILNRMREVDDANSVDALIFSLEGETSEFTTQYMPKGEDGIAYFPRTQIGEDSLGNPVFALFDGKVLGIYRRGKGFEDVIELNEGDEKNLRLLLNSRPDIVDDTQV